MADVDRTNADPSAADPFVPGSLPSPGGEVPPPLSKRESEAAEMAKRDPMGDDGPSYEQHQDPEDTTGGSTDPHNSLGHEDSGNES